MIELEVIFALGVILTPFYIYKFISFIIEVNKIRKEPKIPTTRETIIKSLKNDNIWKGR